MKKFLIGLVMFGLMVSAAVADEADTWKSFINDPGDGSQIIDADDVNPMFLHFTGNLHPRETSGARSTREVFTLGSSSYPWRKIVVSTGDATAPSFTFKNDLDTGAYRVAANLGGLSANSKTIETWGENEVRVGFNGKDKLTIGSAGNGYGYLQGYYAATPLSALNIGLNNYLDATGTTTQEIVGRYAPLLQLVGRGSNGSFDFSVFPPNQTSATLLMSLNSDGNLYWGSTQKGIAQNTSDGADTSVLYISGGGAPAQTRGGYIAIAGNENTDDGGSIALVPGANSASGEVKIYNRSGTQSFKVHTGGQVSMVNQSGARAYMAADETLTAGGTSLINFDTETYDNKGEYDTANKRFTATYAGRYLVMAGVYFDVGATTNEAASLRVYKNDIYSVTLADTLTHLVSVTPYAASVSYRFGALSGTDVLSLAAGDYIDIRIFLGASVNRTLSHVLSPNYFIIEKLN